MVSDETARSVMRAILVALIEKDCIKLHAHLRSTGCAQPEEQVNLFRQMAHEAMEVNIASAIKNARVVRNRVKLDGATIH